MHTVVWSVTVHGSKHWGLVSEMLYIDNVYVYCCIMYIGSFRIFFFFYCFHLLHLIKKQVSCPISRLYFICMLFMLKR